MEHDPMWHLPDEAPDRKVPEGLRHAKNYLNLWCVRWCIVCRDCRFASRICGIKCLNCGIVWLTKEEMNALTPDEMENGLKLIAQSWRK